MTAPGIGRRPNSDAELLRQHEQRLRRLEEASTSRHGQWVVKTDPQSGQLQAMSPDRTVDLTPTPVSEEDVIAGVLPGVFQATRLNDTVFATGAAGNAWFPDDWYDTVEYTSDRLIFDPVTSAVTVESRAMFRFRVSQRIASTVGSRTWRVQLGRQRADESSFTVIRDGINVWQSTNHVVVADTFDVPGQPGDMFRPGFYGAESAANAMTGEAGGRMTRWEVTRLFDMP